MLLRAAAWEWRRRQASRHLLPFCEAIYGPSYLRAKHIELYCEHLEKVEAGAGARLASSMPPRHSKTQTLKAFVAWCIGRHPDWQIIHATSTRDLANDQGREIRDMVADQEYQTIFPGVVLKEDSQAASRFHTNHGGIYVAVGTETRIQGRGAHLLVIDDPVGDPSDADSEARKRRLWRWYAPGAYSRLMPGGRIVINHTRWREDDLIGRVTTEHAFEGWDIVNFPAILPSGRALWPEWRPLEELLRIKAVTPPRDWEALYQGRPTAEEGGILKRHWWKPWTSPDPPECTHVLLSLDGAYSSKDSADFSAATVWGFFRQPVRGDVDMERGADGMILLDAWHDRVEYPEFRNKVAKLIKAHDPDTVLIENKASGLSLIQELRRAGVPVTQFDPRRQGGDKEARANAAANAFSSGAVWYPEKLRGADGTMVRADFAHMVINECAAFPTGANDDLVDTVTQAVLHFRQRGMLRLASDDTWDIPPPPPPRMPGKSYYA